MITTNTALDGIGQDPDGKEGFHEPTGASSTVRTGDVAAEVAAGRSY